MPDPERITPELLAADAQAALISIETTMHAIADLETPVGVERSFLALQLLQASCDHARALIYLLANNPVDLAGSALVLHRAQIENFLRAVFFAIIADAAQLADFIEHDKGPRQLTANRRWANIPVSDLASQVQAALQALHPSSPDDGRLALMVQNAWDPLCAMVHGGRALHVLYRNHRNQVGCSVPPEAYFQTTVNTVAVVNFALALACELAGIGFEQEYAGLQAPSESLHGFIRQHNALLRRVGLHDQVRCID